MKGAYLTIVDTANKKSRGVIQKIESQVFAFKSLGCSMDFFHFDDKIACLNYAKSPVRAKKSIFNKFSHDKLLYIKFLEEDANRDYDFLYIRYPKASPGFISFLKQLKQQNPKISIINEIPTYPYEGQWKTLKSKFIQQLDYLYRGKLKLYVDRIVTFYGQEEIFDIKTIPIGNGINTEVKRIIQRIPPPTKALRLICIANLKFYHGYDRIIRGIAQNPTDYQVFFNIVGGGPEEVNLQNLVRELHLEENVIFHGFKYSDELESLIAQSDIAIGTLGWHRAGISRDSALKTREYCAHAIPFILSNTDQDFKMDFPFMLRVEASDAPVSMSELIAFYKKYSKIQDYQKLMYRYAVQNLDWKVKMYQVLDFVHSTKNS